MAVVNDPQLDDDVEAGVVADMVQQRDIYLLPNDNVRTAGISRF